MAVAPLDPIALEQRAACWWGLWSPDQFVRLIVANGVGLTLIVVGWWEMSRHTTTHGQVGWFNLNVAGLIIGAAANGLWLARGRRAFRLARSAALPHPPGDETWPWRAMVVSRNGSAPPASRGSRRASPGGSDEDGLVASAMMSFFHRSTCPLVQGKDVRVGNRPFHEEAGRGPCELCRP